MATSLLDTILEKAKNTSTAIAASQANAAENFRAMEVSAGKIASIYDQVAVDAATVMSAKQAADLRMQKQNLQLEQAAGIDPEARTNTIVDLITKQQRSNAETESALIELRKAKEINVWEDPVKYVKSYIFDVPIAEDRLQGAAQQMQLYDSQLKNVNDRLQEGFQTNLARRTSVTAASADAASRVAAADSAIAAERARIDGLKYNSAAIQSVAEASKEDLAVWHTAASIANAESSLEIVRANSAREAEAFSWRKEEAAAIKDARETGKELDQSIADTMNLSIASQGGQPLGAREIKQAVQLFKSGVSKEYAYHYENGKRIARDGIPWVGASPSESMQVLKDVQPKLPVMRAKTAELLMEVKALVDKTPGTDPKNKEDYHNKLDAATKQVIETQFASISPGSNNLFDAGELSQYFGMRAVANLPVVKKLLEPLAKNKQPLDDPKLVLQLAAKAVVDGTLTSTEALELSTVYQTANQVNQRARGIIGFGIIPPKAGLAYNAKISGHYALDPSTVDLTNAAAIGRWFSTELYRQSLFNKGPVDLSIDPSYMVKPGGLIHGPGYTGPGKRE